MNAIQNNLTRTLAILAIAIPLASCATPSQIDRPTDASTGVVEVLPTPTTVAVVDTPPAEAPPDAMTPAATIPAPDADWTQESFGDAWTIGYPPGWTVDAAGANEGALQLQGEYNGHSYVVTLSYPIGILVDSLDAWTEEALLPLTLAQREAIVTSDITVANTPAKKILNMPSPDGTATAHHVYIWRADAKNPRLITITQTDGQPVDAVAMDQLLDRLLLTVQ